jgi:hypothetical protein
MGVQGSVISQHQPDLPDTPPVTVRLQHCDNRFYSPAWHVSICNHQLDDLGRAQVHPSLENIIEPQVAIDQRFECQKITERKMDMNIDEQNKKKLRSWPLISPSETDQGLPTR